MLAFAGCLLCVCCRLLLAFAFPSILLSLAFVCCLLWLPCLNPHLIHLLRFLSTFLGSNVFFLLAVLHRR